MQLSALNDFNWGDIGTALSNAISSAPKLYTEYRTSQAQIDAAKAKAQYDAQIAIARASLQPGQGSMFNYGFGNSTRGAAPPGGMPAVYSQGASSMTPILLIGGFTLAAAFLLLRK